MSEEILIGNAGERLEIHQIGREILCIASTASPTLSISQSGDTQIALSQTMQSLILTKSAADTLVIQEPAGDCLVISDTGVGVVSSPYGHPYTSADDGMFHYYAWQHVEGMQWKAQRIELSTLELRSITGANPQPQSLSEFHSLAY